MKKETPLTIDGINENIYAGFWKRLASLLLDVLIVIPFSILILYINNLSINAYYLTFIPSQIFGIWYNVYLVKRYGGTPGKLLTGIKILKIDGSEVTWKEAILRHIVYFVLSLFSLVVMFDAISKADNEYYESIGWMAKARYLNLLAPISFRVLSWVQNIWIYSEFFVLLFNKRKRALHDFIAGTVIVKIKYIDTIRETMNANQS